jgi:hypothetical protein
VSVGEGSGNLRTRWNESTRLAQNRLARLGSDLRRWRCRRTCRAKLGCWCPRSTTTIVNNHWCSLPRALYPLMPNKPILRPSDVRKKTSGDLNRITKCRCRQNFYIRGGVIHGQCIPDARHLQGRLDHPTSLRVDPTYLRPTGQLYTRSHVGSPDLHVIDTSSSMWVMWSRCKDRRQVVCKGQDGLRPDPTGICVQFGCTTRSRVASIRPD